MTTFSLISRRLAIVARQKTSMANNVHRNLISGIVSTPSMQLGPLSSIFRYQSTAAEPLAETVPVTFVYSNGEEVEVQAELGKNFLELAHANNIDLEGKFGE